MRRPTSMLLEEHAQLQRAPEWLALHRPNSSVRLRLVESLGVRNPTSDEVEVETRRWLARLRRSDG
jgi:hypothetical protein